MKTIVLFIIIFNLSCSVIKPSFEKKSGFIIKNEPFKTLIFIEAQETEFDKFVIKNFQNSDFLKCLDTLPNTFYTYWYDDESLMKFEKTCNTPPEKEIQYLYVTVEIIAKRNIQCDYEIDEYYFNYNNTPYCINIDRCKYVIVRL